MKHRLWMRAALLALAALLGVAYMSTRPAEPAAPVSFEEASLRVRIDLSERRVHVEQDGASIASYDAAVGTDTHPTPEGAFQVRRIIWNPRWVPPDAAWARDAKPREPGDPHNPMGRVKIFFKAPDYYVHGTNAEESIGSAASHGCVRLLNEDVIALARTLMEHGGAAVEPGLIRRLINRVRQTKEVRLATPVPLRVEA